MSPLFKKSYLRIKDIEGICRGEGYFYILEGLKKRISASPQKGPLALDSYLKTPDTGLCLDKIYKKRRPARVARWFLRHLARHDGNSRDISLFDVSFAYFHLYGRMWKENWFFGLNHSFEDIRRMGSSLLNPLSSKRLKKNARSYLSAIVTFANKAPLKGKIFSPLESKQKIIKDIESQYARRRAKTFLPTIRYFLKPVEPKAFADYLKIELKKFIQYNNSAKDKLFWMAIGRLGRGVLPSENIILGLLPYLNVQEATIFRKSLFKKDVLKAMSLFEKKSIYQPSLPQGKRNWREIKSNESRVFPNLPIDTPYSVRQKLIDQFLGSPILTRQKKFFKYGLFQRKTTLKKYRWVGDTEVFSLNSGRPGPTTLVFSPHFHEKNPRKYLHWLKDLPLTSGRVIFIPEANRAMGRAHQPTNPMNGLFNEALRRDRVDYLIVRRVEYLMGLVDGLIGVHDAFRGPFFISDGIAKPNGIAKSFQGPHASPWIPKAVKKINKLSPKGSKRPPIQIQWKIAEYARRRLQKLTGQNFRFVHEKIRHEHSGSVDSTTGYMNYILNKPAMTFEGKKGKEHGQLHAMGITTLLQAFGHKVAPSYLKVLKNPHPKVEPKIFVGLPPVPLKN